VAKLDKAAVHIGAVAFILRFGSSLNTHVHCHVCVVDGVFEALGVDITADPATPLGVAFHPASGIDAAAVAQVRAEVRTRILRALAGRGLIERFEAREMLACKHSGVSMNAGVCIEAQDRARLERLRRYCARAPFALIPLGWFVGRCLPASVGGFFLGLNTTASHNRARWASEDPMGPGAQRGGGAVDALITMAAPNAWDSILIPSSR